MKKILIVFSIILFIIINYIYGGSDLKKHSKLKTKVSEIRVLYPAPGTTWIVPQPYPSRLIAWSPGHLCNVDLFRFKGTPIFVKRLYKSIPSHSLSVNVQDENLKNIYINGMYYIVIRSVDGSAKGKSKIFMIKFTVKHSSTMPKIKPIIKIINLLNSAEYKAGGSMNIEWKMNLNKKVRIQLFKCSNNSPGIAVRTLAVIPGSRKRLNRFTWRNIPRNITPGDYCIGITMVDKSTKSFSKMFKIKISPRTSRLHIK